MVAGITELLPLWLAPNLITLIGTIGLVLSYGLFLIYLPALEGENSLHQIMRFTHHIPMSSGIMQDCRSQGLDT